MQKIGILLDTTCDLEPDVQKDSCIKMVALQIIFNDSRIFRDKYEISYKQLIDALDEFEPKTSLPIVQDAVDALDKFVEEGYTHVITMSISSGLSGTHGMFESVSADYKDRLVIANIDTKSVTMGLGYVALLAKDMIEAGKDFDEIVEFVEQKLKKRDVFFAVETLKYLIRGGRISKFSGVVGEALDIKPILVLDSEGKLSPKDKVRGRKKSIARLAELAAEASKGKTIDVIYVLHGDREEEAKLLKEKLAEQTNARVEIAHLGTLVSVHVGPGLVGAFVTYQ